jgi:glucose dehydrogenase
MTKVFTKNIMKVITKRMKKTLSNTSTRAIALAILFIISGIGASLLVNPAAAAPNASPAVAAPSAAAPAALTQAEANWAAPNGNQYNQDYNPQSQINSSNGQYLGLNWLLPLPSLPPGLGSYAGPGGYGVDTAPMIINGTIYAITQFDQIFALNAATGDVIWTDTLPITLNSTLGTSSPLVLHAHDGTDQWSTTLFHNTPTLWLQAADNEVYAINGLNGTYELNFTDFTGPKAIAGNSPSSFYNDVGQANILLDQSAGILITSHGAEADAANGRCYYEGWNILATPPTPLWTSYCTPPQPNSNVPLDPNWDISQVTNMSSAEIFYPGVHSTNGYTTPAEIAGGVQMNTNNSIVVQLKNLTSSQLNSTLYNDWGYAAQTAQCTAITGGQSTGSTGAGWGGAWLLGSGPTAGMAFVNTNNKDPWVGPCTPGPDLWSASLLALNVTTGAWVWGFQANAHDLWDYDCSWWQGMGNETISGVQTQVIFKTCKNGYLFELNAKTGNLIWSWNPPSNIIARCAECYMMNPLNSTQMDEAWVPQTIGGSLTTGYLQYPAASAGFEDEQAYNPVTNTIFAAAQNVPNYDAYLGLNSSTYFTSIGETITPINSGTCAGCAPANNNATIFAINASSGAVEWHYFVAEQGYRGGVSTTGNMVLLALSSGTLLMLNAANGDLVKNYYIGGPLNVLPTIGATTNGTEEVIVPVTAGLVTWATSVPGDLVALTLQGAPTTTATASGKASATTTTATSVSTVTTGAATVTTTVGSAGAASTVTATVSGVTATSTVTSGTSSTALYGVAVVAVIFIIATGYLAMRGRKPAT